MSDTTAEVPAATVDTTPPTPVPATVPDEPLGDGGLKALEAERQARKDLERRLKELEPLAAKAKELEEANKTEAQRLADELAAATAERTTAATELARLQAAMAKAPAGMPAADVARWAARLQGSTVEELEADAEELFATIPATASGSPVSRGPVEALRPGALPATPEVSLQDQISAAEAAGDVATAMALKSKWLDELRRKTP